MGPLSAGAPRGRAPAPAHCGLAATLSLSHQQAAAAVAGLWSPVAALAQPASAPQRPSPAWPRQQTAVWLGASAGPTRAPASLRPPRPRAEAGGAPPAHARIAGAPGVLSLTPQQRALLLGVSVPAGALLPLRHARAADSGGPGKGKSGGGGDGGGGGGAGKKGGAADAGKTRVLIMMSDTGGGHRASAEALKAGFESLYPGKYDVSVSDIWTDHTPYPWNQMPKTYNFSVRHPYLWRFQFRTSEPRWMHEGFANFVSNWCIAGLEAAFARFDPQLIVSVHPLMQHVPLRILDRRAARTGVPRPPFATVVTDFTTCHPTWFHEGVDLCFVPTEFCRQLGLKKGLRPEQLVLHGLPTRPAFQQALPAKAVLRAKLGLAADGPTALVVGGGDGMGIIERTVEALATKLGQGAAAAGEPAAAGAAAPRGQLLVICGRNKKLADSLAARPWPVKVVVKGFVDAQAMSECMGAADCIVTKAGPGTMAEALTRGLPMVLNGFVPCQEEGNIPYVVDNEVGTFNTDPAQIAGIVAGWFAPAGAPALAAMAARAKALGRPQATLAIVKDLAALVKSKQAAATPAAQPVGAVLAAA